MIARAIDARSPGRVLPPGRWNVDPGASSALFRVRHFGFATVEGRFTRLEGTIGTRGVIGSVEVGSIDTGSALRDDRLRSSDFFDVARFPQITFQASGALAGEVRGLMTIKHLTRPVTFEVEAAELADGAARLRATAAVSRAAFGLDWAGLKEAGRLVVSDRVEIRLDLGLSAVPERLRTS